MRMRTTSPNESTELLGLSPEDKQLFIRNCPYPGRDLERAIIEFNQTGNQHTAAAIAKSVCIRVALKMPVSSRIRQLIESTPALAPDTDMRITENYEKKSQRIVETILSHVDGERIADVTVSARSLINRLPASEYPAKEHLLAAMCCKAITDAAYRGGGVDENTKAITRIMNSASGRIELSDASPSCIIQSYDLCPVVIVERAEGPNLFSYTAHEVGHAMHSIAHYEAICDGRLDSGGTPLCSMNMPRLLAEIIAVKTQIAACKSPDGGLAGIPGIVLSRLGDEATNLTKASMLAACLPSLGDLGRSPGIFNQLIHGLYDSSQVAGVVDITGTPLENIGNNALSLIEKELESIARKRSEISP